MWWCSELISRYVGQGGEGVLLEGAVLGVIVDCPLFPAAPGDDTPVAKEVYLLDTSSCLDMKNTMVRAGVIRPIVTD